MPGDKRSSMDDEVEKEMVEAAKKADTQWKLPSLREFFEAVFLSDHYTWMWQPASLIFVYLSYLTVKATEARFGDVVVAYAHASWWPSIIVYWYKVSVYT